MTPFIDQNILTCYKECSLVQWGWDSYLNPPIVYFEKTTGELHVETNDYSFDGLELQLKLECETPYSIQAASETSDIDYFEINFTSECREHALTAPVPQFIQTSATLWSTSHIPYTPAGTANPDCGELHHTIVGAPSPLVTIDTDTNTVNIYGRYKNEVGPVTFRIKACHKNIEYGDDINCV